MEKVKDGKKDWNLAYSEWRNTPTVQGNSPAKLFYGRQVQSWILPVLLKVLDTQKKAEERRGQEEEAGFKRVTRHQAKPLERDEAVWLQNKESGKWNIKGFIRGARPHGRSYIVETVQGSLFLRHRKFMKPMKV